MLVSKESKLDAFFGLVDKMNAEEKAFMIVVYGESVSKSDRAEIASVVAEKYPMLEFYEIDGGQKVYEFIVILE